MEYTLSSARMEEIPAIFALYEKRVAWMDAVGIRQWNVSDYLTAYPASYYEEACAAGSLYALHDGEKIVGAAVLLQSDDRWADRAADKAYYVHNLVTDVAAKGAGRALLAQAEEMARANGMRYMRLDCAVDNRALNEYYASMGYELAGTCEDGPYYKGNRREKAI